MLTRCHKCDRLTQGNCWYCRMVRDMDRTRPVGVVTIECAPCCVCKERGKVDVRRDGYLMFQAGMNVQEALPELDADQRELLISGTHAHCWASIYGGEDDE